LSVIAENARWNTRPTDMRRSSYTGATAAMKDSPYLKPCIAAPSRDGCPETPDLRS
jgi:hypothetical protein